MNEFANPASVDQLSGIFYRMIGKLQVMHRDNPDFSVEDLERIVYAIVRAAKREERSKVENGLLPSSYIELTSDFTSQEEALAAWDDYKLGVAPGKVDDQDAYRSAISSGVLIGLGGESVDENEEMSMKWANEPESDPSAPGEVIRITDDGYTVEYNGSILTADDAVIIDWDSGFPRVTLTLMADKIIIE